MVQQDPVVMADTFLANVTLGRDISEERVWQALETVQLAELARGLSDGMYTRLGEQGNNLSVGQKQLLALARVLVETPQVLIFDQATASIDSGTEQAIQQALAKVRQHTTLVVIAHRLSTIVEADTILAAASRSGGRAGYPSAIAGGERPLLADVSAAAGGRRVSGQRQTILLSLMARRLPGLRPPRSRRPDKALTLPAGNQRWCKNVTSNAPLWCVFAFSVAVAQVLPDRTLICHQRAALRPFFIPGIALAIYPLVLAAAITEF